MQSSKRELKKAASTASKAKANELPFDVRPYDILCGRSKMCFNNIGNRRFRITIGMNVKKYDALPNRTERGKFIVELSRTLREEVGYRFFRVSKKDGKVELSDDEIRAKIGHALRDLSITQATAAEAAANKTDEKETEEQETKSEKSDMESKPRASPTPETTPSAEPKLVTPQPPTRRVTNDFETDSQGNFTGIPQCPDIRRADAMDTSDSSHHDIPKEIFCAPQQHMAPIAEESHPPQDQSSSSVVSTDAVKTPQHGMICDEPIAIEDSASESSTRNRKKEEVGGDDYHMMPLRFNEPEHDILLDPIPFDMDPTFDHMGAKSDTISMAVDIANAPLDFRPPPYYNEKEMLSKIRNMKGFKAFQKGNEEVISVDDEEDDHDLIDEHHMISSGDSVGCLSLDMAIHA